jgi:hypothetical protein
LVWDRIGVAAAGDLVSLTLAVNRGLSLVRGGAGLWLHATALILQASFEIWRRLINMRRHLSPRPTPGMTKIESD